MRQVYQAYARTCDFLTHTFFFLNSQLHAIFCAFYSPFLVKVHASGTVILQGSGSILIAFYYNYFLSKCALFIHLPSSFSEVS